MTEPLPAKTSQSGRFAALRTPIRELWIIFGAKLLGILAYSVMNSTLILWLSADLGYSDVRAGQMVAWWSTAMTLSTVMVGSLVDAIGIRKALLMGFSVCFFSRAVMAFTSAKWVVLPFGLFLVAVGESMLTPVMVAAVRRYSTTGQRSMAFSVFYALMNAGFGIASLLFDGIRSWLGENGRYVVPMVGAELSSYQTLFLASFLLTLPNMAMVYLFLRPGAEATDEGLRFAPEKPREAGASMGQALRRTVASALRDTTRIFAGLWRQPAFYKFLVFLSLVVPVRLIFYHMYYTYPKFGIRELSANATYFSVGEIKDATRLADRLSKQGDELTQSLYERFSESARRALAEYPKSGAEPRKLQPLLAQELNIIVGGASLYKESAFRKVKLRSVTLRILERSPQGAELARLNRLLLEDAYPKHLGASAPIGRLWSINSFLILILVPLVGILTQKVPAFPMVVLGSFISATSVFIMALPPDWFQPLADGNAGHWIGHVWLGVQGTVHPYYVMICLYVVLLSVGESLWSPRLYEYTAAVAPKGQEASYMSLSYLPFFVAKFFVGMSSGWLLARYCPEDGPRNSPMLWLIIALTTFITPLGLIVFRRFIRISEAGRNR